MNNLYVISGATGMTGSELTKQLLKRGDIVLGFDNFFASSIDSIKDVLDNKNLHFYEYEINNKVQMTDIFNKIALFSIVGAHCIFVNCAAVVHTKHFYEVEHTFQTNVVAMREFLQMAIKAKADMYVNCSTSEVYSMQSWNAEGGVKESDFLLMATAEHSQRTSYAVGKLLTEFFMKDAVDKGLIKGCSMRFANVYSNHERFADHIIPHIFNELLTRGKVRLLENSKKNRRCFLHNIDSCRAVLYLMDTPEAMDGTVYNVGTDEEISIIELVNQIGIRLGIEKPEIIFEGYRKSDPERRILNTDKIKTRTEWRPIITLEKGLDMCVEGYKNA